MFYFTPHTPTLILIYWKTYIVIIREALILSVNLNWEENKVCWESVIDKEQGDLEEPRWGLRCQYGITGLSECVTVNCNDRQWYIDQGVINKDFVGILKIWSRLSAKHNWELKVRDSIPSYLVQCCEKWILKDTLRRILALKKDMRTIRNSLSLEFLWLFWELFTRIFTIHRYITNSRRNQLLDGLIAQLVDHCTVIGRGHRFESRSGQIYFQGLISQYYITILLYCVYNRDDQSCPHFIFW